MAINYQELREQVRRTYAQTPASNAAPEPFPSLPDTESAEDFVDILALESLRRSPKLLHPFAVRLARGQWNVDQVRDWIRQDYQWILHLIRRHSLLAANATDYETIWALLTRVKAEADADPVGGNFFALPQLWIKFGIAVGLERADVAGWQSHPMLRILSGSLLNEVRFANTVPAKDLVDSLLDPIFYQVWGEALASSLQVPQDSLDFFWALGADRWGEETGRAILLRRAGSREAQTGLWNELGNEPGNAVGNRSGVGIQQDPEWQRFTILEGLLNSPPQSGKGT